MNHVKVIGNVTIVTPQKLSLSTTNYKGCFVLPATEPCITHKELCEFTAFFSGGHLEVCAKASKGQQVHLKIHNRNPNGRKLRLDVKLDKPFVGDPAYIDSMKGQMSSNKFKIKNSGNLSFNFDLDLNEQCRNVKPDAAGDRLLYHVSWHIEC